MSDYIPTAKAAKKLWDEVIPIFEALLDDLKSKNMIRLTIKMDREKLALIWKNSAEFGKAHNEFVKNIYPEKLGKEFSKKSGLTEETIAFIYLTQLISHTLIQYESVFRTSLLFFLEEDNGIRRDMTLTRLLKAIVRISPSAGGKVKKLIDTDLRNSLAHGTFWFKRGGKVSFAKNSYLQEIREMSLANFMKESIKVNVIAHAFVYTLHKKMTEGFFKY
jgi:hypothetical protein